MLIHLGDFSERNSLDLACGMGKIALFLHELSTATVEKRSGEDHSGVRKGCTVKAMAENGNGSVQEGI